MEHHTYSRGNPVLRGSQGFDFYPATTFDHTEIGYALGLNVNKHLTNTFSVHGGFYYGSLKGTKRFFGSKLYRGGVYFETNMFQYHVGGRVNVKNFLFPESTQFNKKFALYLFGEVGFINFDSELRNLRDDSKPVWRQGKADPGNTTETIMAFGPMAKWHLNPRMDVGVMASYNYVFTDKLDAWIERNSSRDGWGYAGVTFTYHIFNKNKQDQPLEWAVSESDVNGKIKDLEDRLGDTEQKVEDLEKKLKEQKPAPAPAPTPVKEPEPTPEPEPAPTPTPTQAAPADLSNLDTDRDGVPDNRDKELFSPGGAKVNADGVAEDADGDGVPDVIDLEPGTPKGSLVNFKGQKIEVTKTVIQQGGGAPSSQRPVGGGDEADRIYFNDASFEILPTEAAKLDAYAQKMKTNGNLKIKIVGQASFYGE